MADPRTLTNQELAEALDIRAVLSEQSPTGWALAQVNVVDDLREAARRLRQPQTCETCRFWDDDSCSIGVMLSHANLAPAVRKVKFGCILHEPKEPA